MLEMWLKTAAKWIEIRLKDWRRAHRESFWIEKAQSEKDDQELKKKAIRESIREFCHII